MKEIDLETGQKIKKQAKIVLKKLSSSKKKKY